MTKEELKQEAEEYFKSICGDYNEEYERTGKRHYWVGYDIKNAYLASAEPREKRIKELEKACEETQELLDKQIEATYKLDKENAVLEKRIERAKECMKKLLFIINSEPANYNCKGLVKDAEDFIYNRTCNIRQQGEHCITKERCIMCDK